MCFLKILLLTDQLKMAFLSQWIESASNIQVSLSYILISVENNGKAVEDKVIHVDPAHFFTHKESAPKNEQYEKHTKNNDEK